MKRRLNEDQTRLLKLAKLFLSLAGQKMSAQDVKEDKRCRYARNIVKDLTKPASFCPKCGANVKPIEGHCTYRLCIASKLQTNQGKQK